jgi:hypothetical protein
MTKLARKIFVPRSITQHRRYKMGEAKEWGKALGHFIESGGTRTEPSREQKESEREKEAERRERDDDD